ncbi:MAG: glycosyltransferase, partial [Bacteroidota bacterium]
MLPVLVVAFVVQALAWAGVAAGLRRVREDEEALLDAADPEAATPEAEPALFSVVVAAHDEADRLPALLGALEAQTHRLGDGTPAFEVVVVDDRSADGTADVAERWARAWTRRGGPDLRVVRVAEGAPEAAGLPPKKHAIERGIEAARHDRLALTDADCAPPPTWLEALARLGDDNAVLVGTGPLAEAPGWLNRFARYETLQTAALSAAAIGLGRPWHAVGRNLSYPASLLPRLG